MIDEGLEKRNFSSDPSQTHNRGQYVDKYLESLSSTLIVGQKRKRPASASVASASALRRAHANVNRASGTQGVKGAKRDLAKHFKRMDELCRLLNLEKRVLDRAKDLLVRFEKANFTHETTDGKPRKKEKKKNMMSDMATCIALLHLACDQLNIGRPINDLLIDLAMAGAARPSGSSGGGASNQLPEEKEIWATRKKIVKKLPGVDVATRPDDVIYTFIQTLALPFIVERVARNIYEKLQPFVEGKSTSTIAAGSIFLACQALNQPNVEKEDVAGIAGIAVSTLMNFCKVAKKHDVLPTTEILGKMKTN